MNNEFSKAHNEQLSYVGSRDLHALTFDLYSLKYLTVFDRTDEFLLRTASLSLVFLQSMCCFHSGYFFLQLIKLCH